MVFAVRFRRNTIFRRPENTKITEKLELKTQWIQRPENCYSLRLIKNKQTNERTNTKSFKCGIDALKIAVDKGVTLLRFQGKGHQERAGEVVLALPRYSYYIVSSVLLVYIIAWGRGQLKINFTSIFKVWNTLKIQVKLILKLPESTCDYLFIT